MVRCSRARGHIQPAWIVGAFFFTSQSLTRGLKGGTHMRINQTSSGRGVSAPPPNATQMRLQGRWLLLARCVWITLVVLTLAIFFASLPVYLAQLQTPCSGTPCAYDQFSPAQVGALKRIGLSLGDYALYTLALTLASVVLCLVVSTLIVWRRSDDRMALLVALLLVTLGPIVVTSSVPVSPSPWQVPNECLTYLALALLVFVFLLFPNGQFVPRSTRCLLVVFLAGLIPTTFLGPAMPNTLVDTLGYLVSLCEAAVLAFIQLYRYRQVSSPIQRQQTKWVVFGFAEPAIVYVGGYVLGLIFPWASSSQCVYQPASAAVNSFLVLFIPLSFGFAMLRSRLWDIDVLINRTLVNGTLTASLALIYVGLVIGLQALLRGLISQDNSVAIVISTLAIYVLFQPLRQGIQRLIDRRFYRSKYDARRIIDAFSTTLRAETDLTQLSEQLVAVVQETMQPAHISLWLRKPSRTENPPLQAGEPPL